MDDAAVRKHAEAHGQAVAAGDLRTAAGDLTPEAQAAAGEVMRRLPRPVTGAEVISVEDRGDEGVAQIRYGGEPEAVTVESRWAERDGRPKIVDLRIV